MQQGGQQGGGYNTGLTPGQQASPQPDYKTELTPEQQLQFEKSQELVGSDPNQSMFLGANNFNTTGIERLGKAAMAGYGQAGSRSAPQLNSANQNAWRGQQMGLADALNQQMRAPAGPSLAEMQLRRGAESNMAQAMAMQAGARGQNAGGAMRQINQQRAAMGQQLGMDTAMLRAQEFQADRQHQLAAANSLGQLTTGARGQDIGFASAGAQVELEQQKQNDAMTQYYMSMGFNAEQAAMAARQALEQNKVQRYGIDRGIAVQQNAQTTQLVGAGIAAGGALLAASDERLKKDIRSGDKDTYSFLDALNAAKYSYKEPKKFGDGERVSVMAQELERSKLGKDFVVETKEGKMVDYGKGLGTLLAASSSLHKRLKKLEGS